MLFLKVAETILLPPILTNEFLHSRVVFNINLIFLELQSELVDKAKELGSDAHDHVPDIVLPSSKVVH